MKFFFDLSLLSFLIHISIEANLQKINSQKRYNISKNKRSYLKLSRKEENNNKEIDEITIIQLLNSFVNNITTKYEKELLNLNKKINNIINSSLESQNEMIEKVKNERKVINNLLNEITLLKIRYKENQKYTYILIGIVFVIFLIFYFIDFLKRDNFKGSPSGYHKADDGQNNNNQISII